jgi:ATP-dependent DNA helicase RecG
MIPGLVEEWLENKLPNVFDRDRMVREQHSELPFEMVREAVVNALIHRDYDIEGAKCQLVVTEDTVTVMSPGQPPPPITLDQLQTFTAPMLSRNPALHLVFARMGMAEEQGLGLVSLRDRARELALPLPRYTWKDPYLVLTLYRSAEAATRQLADDVLRKLNASEKKGWEFLSTRMAFTRAEYEAQMGIDKRKAQRHLRRFVELELVRPVGAGRGARYEVLLS